MNGGIGEDRRDDVIRLAEETVAVGKRRIDEGSVSVKTLAETFDEAMTADLIHEGAEVTRIAIGTEVTIVPQIRTEGDVTIVPVLEEVLVVEKRLVLKEEIHIRRTKQIELFKSHVTLRRQRAVIERRNAAGETISDDQSDKPEETT